MYVRIEKQKNEKSNEKEAWKKNMKKLNWILSTDVYL